MKNLKKSLMYTGLVLAVLTAGVAVKPAISGTGTELITINVAIPDPDVILTGLTWSSGTFFALNNAVSSASATVSTAGVVTAVTGTPGNARLIGANTTGTALDVLIGSVTAGAPSATMTYQVSDDLVTGPTVLLDGGTPDAQFKIDTWTMANSTPASGSFAGFVPATGLATITLSTGGLAHFKMGAKLSTVPSAQAYTAQAYTGTVRVTISY